MNNLHQLTNFFFGKYGTMPRIEICSSTKAITELEFSAVFCNYRNFEDFALDLLKFEEIEAERRIREKNPIVQRAYEEYQILLKLSK